MWFGAVSRGEAAVAGKREFHSLKSLLQNITALEEIISGGQGGPLLCTGDCQPGGSLCTMRLVGRADGWLFALLPRAAMQPGTGMCQDALSKL